MKPGAGQLVIFGLTGDLARRYVLPALYRLVADDLLPAHFQIIGVSRRAVSTDEVLAFMHQDARFKPQILSKLKRLTSMHQMDLGVPADYLKLKAKLDEAERTNNRCYSRLFYLSLPPSVFGPVIDQLGASDLNTTCVHGETSRLMVEKPFGFDLASAEELIARIGRQFKEDQVYRIDHYLAKDTVQNILTFRFTNPLFESVWHGQAVARIVITAAESVGIEGRTAFYEQTGALRDLVQNHLLQLLTLVAMEEPDRFEPNLIHAEKLKLLEAVRRIEPDEVADQAIRGQYRGYTAEVGNSNSTIETFAALRLNIDNDRWRGVPVILRSGKALNAKRTEITLLFKDRHTHRAIDNRLTIRLQPDEGIGLGIMVKRPGLKSDTELVDMDFGYRHNFDERHPDAYERVLVDAMRGDRTLFATSAEVLESWRIVEPVIAAWARDDDDLELYQKGATAEELSSPLIGQ